MRFRLYTKPLAIQKLDAPAAQPLTVSTSRDSILSLSKTPTGASGSPIERPGCLMSTDKVESLMHTRQVQSGLLMLPVEIRRLIFDHLVSGPGICIDENGTSASGKEVPIQYRQVGRCRLATCNHDSEASGKRIDALYLMLICQQL